MKLTARQQRILRERDEREAREDEFWQKQAVRVDTIQGMMINK